MLLILIWLAFFGVWPLAHPDHDLDTMMGVLDVTIHFTAGFILLTQYRIVRRSS